MLDVTKQIWQMLLEGKSNDEILKICSVSSLSKVRAEFNRQKASGELKEVPEKFPQPSRAKAKVDDIVKPLLSKNDGYVIPKTMFEQMKYQMEDGFKLPSNYPQPGKPDVKVQENFEKGEKSFDVKSYEIKTLEDLVLWAKIDMDQYECVSFTANRWGNAQYECTQCKGVFKPRVKNGLTPEEAAEVFIGMVKNYNPPVYYPTPKSGLNLYKTMYMGNIAESVAMDIHFGSLTRKEETGIDYDIDIAAKDVLESSQFHLDFIGNFNPEKIIMPIGSDFFNVDTVLNTTTNGTFQSERSTWKHTFDRGCRLIVASIDMHKQIAPVEVLIILGNHDTQRSFALGAFLKAWYRNDPLVIINNEPTVRKYFSWGTTLIGLSHGQEKAGTNYLGLMNIEAREACGKAVYKEFHLGHKHHLNVKEDLGFRVRGLGGLTATDEWHSKMGYGALRESQAFIINDERGIIAQSSFHPSEVM